jgi:ribonuclease P protein component
MSGLFTFSKEERLSHKKEIDALFNEGLSFTLGNFRIFYLLRPPAADGVRIKVLVAVPKKKFKRAVDRNRLRRMIREAYRLNRHLLTEKMETIPCLLYLGFVYIADCETDYTMLEKQATGCLEKMGRILLERNR